MTDSLLGSRDEERATLTVQPTAVDTKRIYEHWGWRQVGQVEGGPGGRQRLRADLAACVAALGSAHTDQ